MEEKFKDCGEPADFDEFSEKQKKRLAAVLFEDTTEFLLAAERTGDLLPEPEDSEEEHPLGPGSHSSVPEESDVVVWSTMKK